MPPGWAESAVPDWDAIPEADGSAAVVWHRRDLRIPDNRAVEVASEDFETVCPLFVVDPHFYGDRSLACDARIRFLHECLADFDAAYGDHGTSLVLGHGRPERVLDAFLDRGWQVVVNREPTGRYGNARDERVASRAGVRFVADDGLRYGQTDRDGWREHLTEHLAAAPNAPAESGFGDHGVTSPVTVSAIESLYDVDPQKTDVPQGGRTAGLDRLDQFLDLVPAYERNISSPRTASDLGSRLSPHLRFGALSVREVVQALDGAVDCRGTEAFPDRLVWNRHYSQKLVDWAGWLDTAVNPVLEDLYADTRDPERVEAWKSGQTGFPMVDASMRCLTATGWLNFRMRAMVASLFSLVLKQPWQVGADFMYHHLIDADPAINYTHWQSHSGLKGIGAVRLYNPRKQVRDNDPDGEFIRRWVPELAPVPDTHLDRPERMPLHVQHEVGVDIGTDYPRPIVDYERERKAALDDLAALRGDSEAAMRDPEVFRRASLSRRGSANPDPAAVGTAMEGESEPGARQTDLDRFTD